MSKYNLLLITGEKTTVELAELSITKNVKITNDYREILKLLGIGTNLPIFSEFEEYILHDLRHFQAKSLVLIESNNIEGHTLIYHHDKDSLFFGFFSVINDDQDNINSLIDVLIKYAKKNNFKNIQGPINIPTIIYGWGFMEEHGAKNLMIHKPVNSPIYNQIFEKWSFLEYSKDISYEGYISDFPSGFIDKYEFNDYEIVHYDNWDNIEKIKTEFLVLNARNLPKISVITPDTGALFNNYFAFVKRYGDPFMFVFVRYQKTNELVGCMLSIPNPFSKDENSILNSFVLLSMVIAKNHRNKGLGLLVIDHILKEAKEHNMQYLATCIGSHVVPTIEMCKKYELTLTRTHTIYNKQL